MAVNEREHHIKVLENLLSYYKAREQCEGYYDSTLKDNVEALEYAISSLKTDEAYQLMYEGKEVYAKADLKAILVELQLEVHELWDNNADYIEGVHDSEMIIQQKINKLKENENGNK